MKCEACIKVGLSGNMNVIKEERADRNNLVVERQWNCNECGRKNTEQASPGTYLD